MLTIVVLMRPTNNSAYLDYYSGGDPDLLTVCQVTAIVTAVELQFNGSGTINVNNVQEKGQLPDDPLISSLGHLIWMYYFTAQSPFTNTMADDVLSRIISQNNIPSGHTMSILVGKCGSRSNYSLI